MSNDIKWDLDVTSPALPRETRTMVMATGGQSNSDGIRHAQSMFPPVLVELNFDDVPLPPPDDISAPPQYQQDLERFITAVLGQSGGNASPQLVEAETDWCEHEGREVGRTAHRRRALRLKAASRSE